MLSAVFCLDRYSDTNVNMDEEVFCAAIGVEKKITSSTTYSTMKVRFGLKETKTSQNQKRLDYLGKTV